MSPPVLRRRLASVAPLQTPRGCRSPEDGCSRKNLPKHHPTSSDLSLISSVDWHGAIRQQIAGFLTRKPHCCWPSLSGVGGSHERLRAPDTSNDLAWGPFWLPSLFGSSPCLMKSGERRKAAGGRRPLRLGNLGSIPEPQDFFVVISLTSSKSTWLNAVADVALDELTHERYSVQRYFTATIPPAAIAQPLTQADVGRHLAFVIGQSSPRR